jgi:hypothetical protein
MARWKGFKNKAEKCYYCLASVQELRSKGVYMTVDHVLPKSKGGSNEETNLVTACERCNNMKSDSDGWYEGCVSIEAFGHPEWFRDILLAEEQAKKELELGKKKNGKRVVGTEERNEKDWRGQSLGRNWQY